MQGQYEEISNKSKHRPFWHLIEKPDAEHAICTRVLTAQLVYARVPTLQDQILEKMWCYRSFEGSSQKLLLS